MGSFFLKYIKKQNASILLDVGCGNNSPWICKRVFPSIKYTGLDVGDYNQTQPVIADEYILTSPENFHLAHRGLKGFDAVISSHNLEHVDDRHQTLLAMITALKPGGYIYLAFPCESSVAFPSRRRTLNYFDDPTHREVPPDFDNIVRTLEINDFEIIRKHRSYRPLILRLIGMLQEPIAARQKTILQGTWAYYGFESIICARNSATQSS